MFYILLTWAIACLPFTNAIPTDSLKPSTIEKRCTNVLENPSFESGLSPWLHMGFGSWSTYAVYTSSGGGHDGNNLYYGQSNATKAASTLTVAQSGFSVPAGATVECSAWIASNRPGNSYDTEVQVFLDQVSCGSSLHLGTNGWVKVGGQVTVSAIDMHTFTIVAISGETGPQGSQVWIDDAMVGTGC